MKHHTSTPEKPSTPEKRETTIEDLIERVKALKVAQETKDELLTDCKSLQDPRINARVRSNAVKGIATRVAELDTPSKTGSDSSPSRDQIHEFVDRVARVVGVAVVQRCLLSTEKNMEESVLAFFKARGHEVAKVGDKVSGTHSGLAVTLGGGERFYIKSHDNHKQTASDGKLDPRELLLYKVLEFTGFGPKVEFIPAIKSGRANAFYIGTLDVSHTKNQFKEKTFYTATEYQVKEGLSSAEIDSFKGKNDRLDVEVCAMELMDKIFALQDTFVNPGNYGIVESRLTTEDGKSPSATMKPKLVDFSPPALGDRVASGASVIGDNLLSELKLLNSKPLRLLDQGKTKFYKKELDLDKVEKVGIIAAVEMALKCVEEVLDKGCAESLLIPNYKRVLDEYVQGSVDNFQAIKIAMEREDRDEVRGR